MTVTNRYFTVLVFITEEIQMDNKILVAIADPNDDIRAMLSDAINAEKDLYVCGSVSWR